MIAPCWFTDCPDRTNSVYAASRANGLTYSRLIAGLKKANIGLDRRVLANLAVHDKPAFTVVVAQAKAALA